MLYVPDPALHNIHISPFKYPTAAAIFQPRWMRGVWMDGWMDGWLDLLSYVRRARCYYYALCYAMLCYVMRRAMRMEITYAGLGLGLGRAGWL